MAEAARELPRPFEVVVDSDEERDRWLEARCSGIGASEIAVILGASEWESLLELYYRKIGEAPEDETSDHEDEWLFWGRALEDKIRAELCRRAGVELVQVGTLLRSTEHHWALATPDGLTADGEPVETKNISWGYDPEEWAEQIPEKYYLQCQQQMLVTGARRCLFGALLWGSRLIWEWVPRDEHTIGRIVAAGSKFWRHVERREPPLSDGHPGARKLLGKLAVAENEIELYEPEIEQHLATYQEADVELAEIRKQERTTKKRRDAAADAIAQRMGTHRKAFTATGWSFRWETVRRAGYTVAPSEFEQLKIKAPKAPK
jgi:putative phage-type endonuclease